mgnify:CR=1 FL=1
MFLVREDRRTLSPAIIALIALVGTVYNTPALAIDLRGSLWERVAKSHQLDPYLLYAVAIAESLVPRGDSRVSPWPWTIRTPRESIYARTREEVEARLRLELARWGEQANFDVGLMQISTSWHSWRVRSPVDLLEPEVNLRIAAEVLSEALLSSPDDPVLGIGRYHSWHPERARWYGERVFDIYRQLVGEITEARPVKR